MAFEPPSFDLDEIRVAPGTRVAVVSGEIHVSTAPEFRARLSRILSLRPHAFVVDMSAVEFIDSTGLSVLLSALRRVERHGGRLAIVAANPTVLRLFEVTGLAATFDIHRSRALALASLGVPEPQP